MARTAIISVDGHVRASRRDYRNYVEKQYLDVFDEWLELQEAAGAPEHGGLRPGLDATSQWDSQLRLKDMESQGVVAEVLFPNGLPFQTRPGGRHRCLLGPRDRSSGPDGVQPMAGGFLRADARAACGSGPRLLRRRRAGGGRHPLGQRTWAGRRHDAGPAPGGTFFFDPALDPVWAACVEVDLPVSQHGGSGAPAYGPPGFAAIMTLALEHSFYSGRSLWQMILGGVFERFPTLRVAFVETEADWIAPMIRKLDRRLDWGDDWTGWAQILAAPAHLLGPGPRVLGGQLLFGYLPVHRRSGTARRLGSPERRLRGLRHRLRQRHVRRGLPALRIGVPRDRHPGRGPGGASQHHERGGSEDPLRERGRVSTDSTWPCLKADVERIGFDIDGSVGRPPGLIPPRRLLSRARSAAATWPNQRADGLMVRANVVRSTAMSPKVFEKPEIHS